MECAYWHFSGLDLFCDGWKAELGQRCSPAGFLVVNLQALFGAANEPFWKLWTHSWSNSVMDVSQLEKNNSKKSIKMVKSKHPLPGFSFCVWRKADKKKTECGMMVSSAKEWGAGLVYSDASFSLALQPNVCKKPLCQTAFAAGPWNCKKQPWSLHNNGLYVRTEGAACSHYLGLCSTRFPVVITQNPHFNRHNFSEEIS